MIRLAAMAFSAFALISSPAFGWGSMAHRVMSDMAEDHLTDEARAAIIEILGAETIAEASTWADFMRSSPEPFWQNEAGPYHFATIPPGMTYAEIGAPPQGDAITGMERFTAVLRDPEASLEDRQLALRFLIHIIGDIHQPFHVGNGQDRGANDVRVRWFGEQTNLHRVWDTHIVEHENLSYTEMASWLRAYITPDDVEAWTEIDPVVWAEESAAIRDTLYPEGDNPNLTWQYAFEHRDTMRLRLMQGAIRKAAYLNWLFSSEG